MNLKVNHSCPWSILEYQCFKVVSNFISTGWIEFMNLNFKVPSEVKSIPLMILQSNFFDQLFTFVKIKLLEYKFPFPRSTSYKERRQYLLRLVSVPFGTGSTLTPKSLVLLNTSPREEPVILRLRYFKRN
jgi:hypothetical protein